jgi:hypothetical protein
MYIAWENAGKDITGQFAYYFLDYEQKEVNQIATAIFGFTALADLGEILPEWVLFLG